MCKCSSKVGTGPVTWPLPISTSFSEAGWGTLWAARRKDKQPQHQEALWASGKNREHPSPDLSSPLHLWGKPWEILYQLGFLWAVSSYYNPAKGAEKSKFGQSITIWTPHQFQALVSFKGTEWLSPRKSIRVQILSFLGKMECVTIPLLLITSGPCILSCLLSSVSK